MAAMPCCYYGKRQLSENNVPYALKRSLGKSLASDIDRCVCVRETGAVRPREGDGDSEGMRGWACA